MIKSRKRSGKRGFALMLVILEMVLIAGLWGIAHGQLVTTMRFLTVQGSNLPVGVDIHKSLAGAIALLETGDPPDGGSGVYTCNLTLLTNAGPAYFIITYQKQDTGGSGSGSNSNDETWTVTATQQTVAPQDLAAWNSNLMPSTFAN